MVTYCRQSECEGATLREHVVNTKSKTYSRVEHIVDDHGNRIHYIARDLEPVDHNRYDTDWYRANDSRKGFFAGC